MHDTDGDGRRSRASTSGCSSAILRQVRTADSVKHDEEHIGNAYA